jgi:uncharacterized protein (TIGR03437 family)
MRRSAILFAVGYFAIGGAISLGQTLGDATAVNAGNLAGAHQNNYGVAPGSRFALLGAGLGRDSSQETFPLATQLGGASVKVTVGGFTADCWILSARGDRVVALLPSSTPAGDGTVTLTEGPNTATTKIHVIPVALGLLARNQSDLGPAFAFHDNKNPVTLFDSAQTGENVTLRATGLGAVGGDEGAGPVPADLSVPLDVRVGGVVATAVSARRSDSLAGVDEIVIQIPPGVQGCSVPVAIRAAGMVSNYTTVPVHDGGGACSDPYGLTSDALSSLPGGNARIGVVSLSRSNISAGVTSITDTGNLGFFSYSSDQLVSRRGLTVPTAPGACVVLSITDQRGDTSADPVTGSALRVGRVSIAGPKGTKIIDPSNAGKLGESIQLPVPAGVPPGLIPRGGDLFLDPGSYTVSATSGVDVGAFSAAFRLPAAVEWSNQPSFPASLNQLLPRDQDLLFQWKNGNDPDLVLIQGYGLAPEGVGAAFICMEWASKGSFAVPSFVLSSIPVTPPQLAAATVVGGGGFLSLGTVMGNPARFKSDQLDLGLVTFSTTSQASVGGWR